MRIIRRLLCAIGLHGPYRLKWGGIPATTFRWCSTCWTKWQGTYDGINPGWRRVPDHVGTTREDT